jgi:release factor glutamine methyltransferase
MNQKQQEIQWLLQDKYKGIETPEFEQDVERLDHGEPLDYVIGFSNFLDCKIDLSKRPLIPRLETEFWADQAIEDIKANNPNAKVLDIFAGSGCIGIAALKHLKNISMVFAEFDENAVPQIEINAKLNGISPDRYKVVHYDVFEKVVGKFDYILANPPYIPLKNKHKVQESAIKHEPHMALFGKEDGMFFITRFLKEVKNFLNSGGKVYMEFDSPQESLINDLLTEAGYKQWEFHRDQFGYIRYVTIKAV